jgi:hypothetical protein
MPNLYNEYLLFVKRSIKFEERNTLQTLNTVNYKIMS